MGFLQLFECLDDTKISRFPMGPMERKGRWSLHPNPVPVHEAPALAAAEARSLLPASKVSIGVEIEHL